MNIYNAIMKAADHIERNPSEFRFCSVTIPTGCGTPGCALGWIGFFAGCHSDRDRSLRSISLVARTPPHMNDPKTDAALGYDNPLFGDIDTQTFYNRMSELSKPASWQFDAMACARALRLYAAKYHGEQKPASPPDWNAMAAKWTIGDDVRSQEVAA